MFNISIILHKKRLLTFSKNLNTPPLFMYINYVSPFFITNSNDIQYVKDLVYKKF